MVFTPGCYQGEQIFYLSWWMLLLLDRLRCKGNCILLLLYVGFHNYTQICFVGLLLSFQLNIHSFPYLKREIYHHCKMLSRARGSTMPFWDQSGARWKAPLSAERLIASRSRSGSLLQLYYFLRLPELLLPTAWCRIEDHKCFLYQLSGCPGSHW